MLNRSLFLLILILFASTAWSQTYKQYIKNADEAFEGGDFYKASLFYRKAVKLKEYEAETYYKLATSLRQFNDYSNAAEAYKETLRLDNYKTRSFTEYWLAVMLKNVGHYDESLKHFRNFHSRYPNTDFYKGSAANEIVVLENIDELLEDTIEVEFLHYNKPVNTAWSDFAASMLPDSLLQISSLRPGEKDSVSDERLFYSRIYGFEKKKNKWREVDDFFRELNSIEKHVANFTFTEDATEMFFTICEENESRKLHCLIYQSRLMKGAWSKPSAVDINLPCCTSTQPSIGKTEDARDILFFASDRAGSTGGMDIWYSIADPEGRFKNAVNAGEKINTVGDEITPFYESSSGRLYFSSNWHPGLGGYDIFYSEKEDNAWGSPVNRGIPFNTSYNDIYFTASPNSSSGHFSSNRPGSLYLKGETCCNDVYRWDMPVDTTVSYPDTTVAAIVTDTTKLDTSFITVNNEPELPEADTTVKVKTPVFPDPEFAPDPGDNISRMKDLLPVTLYFHNDEPDCCTLSDTTKIDYKSSYEDYSSLLPEYIRQFQRVEANEDQAKKEIEDFFEEKVDQGMIDLIRFMRLLQDELESGNTIDITIEGYCSPLAVSPYNISLAKRRIESLKNYFRKFRKGIFKEYLQSGKLILKEKPFGEELADQSISDDPADKPNSVYHPQAALERKVEIIAIDVSK